MIKNIHQANFDKIFLKPVINFNFMDAQKQ